MLSGDGASASASPQATAPRLMLVVRSEINPEKDHSEMKMNIALWIIQIILGIKLITVSYTHGLRQSQPTMQEAIQKMGKFSQPLLYIIAVCTFIGTIGLILPGVLGSSTWITPVAAVILSIMLLFSIFFHIKCREKPKIIVSLILFALAVFVAYGRWVLVPL
jgi:VIT1/CCC1 family predicted Fe2+/Mn2+ transporter